MRTSRFTKKLILYVILNLFLSSLLFFDTYMNKINGVLSYIVLTFLILILVFCTVLFVIFIKRVIRSKESLTRIIIGTALLIGLIILSYANIYQQIHRIYGKKAFSGETLSSNDFLYYSITTFTTTGYGDITSVGLISNVAAASQMLFGCIMNTILIAILTSIIMSRLKE